MTMDPVDLKSRFQELSGVSDDGLVQLLETTTVVCPAAGDTIIAAGAGSDTMYFICDGSVRVSLESADECSILGDFGRGQWIGEMGMLKPARASASVVAREDCVLLALSHDGFAALRRRSPALTSVLLQMLCRDLSARLHATIGFIDTRNSEDATEATTLRSKMLIEIARNLLGIAARTGA